MTSTAIEPTLVSGVKVHTHCRVCKALLPPPYLDLGEQPLANALVHPYYTDQPERKYPLAVTLCENCGLSQLTVVVDPKILYTHYRFASGVSRPWLNHCADLAGAIKAEMGTAGFVIDIAANDGSQLMAFKDGGPEWKLLGIEPSDVPLLNLSPDPTQVVRADIPMIRKFWSQSVAERVKTVYGLADVVIAQNVLGHVDDAVGFLKAIQTVLAEDGKVVIEVPNVGDLVDNMAFDTIYHEHLSYWSGFSISRVALEAGFFVERWERFPDIHGGTVRYWLERNTQNFASPLYVDIDTRPYRNFSERVSNNLNQTASIIDSLRKKKFLAWGASAKGAVMMNAIRNRWPAVKLPSAVIDQTPEKQNLLVPGVYIPVIAPPKDLSDVDAIWILSWNWLERLQYEAQSRGFKGKFLVTSPQPRLL